MRSRRTLRRALRPRFDRLDDRWLPSGLTAAQIGQAYGFNAAGGDGSGQTIAIVGAYHNPYLVTDVATFDAFNGLYGTNANEVSGFLTQINLAGNSTDDGWAAEASLDAEAIRASAPAARIIVVEAKSANVSDLLAAVDVARSIPSVSVISMSWGGAEFRGETSLDAYFTTPAGHIPITFLAATGDDGAHAGAEWPASSPNVIAVGGTTLYTDTSGNYQGEQGWSGSGGGFSTFVPEPTYQLGVQSSGRRTTPDVSIVASPSSGLLTYSTAPSTGVGSWDATGGTSLSTQLWAGLVADANHVRASYGKGTLDTATALTLLYNNAGAFRDIAWGLNGYWSTAGYDLVTGLGTPKAPAVVAALNSLLPANTNLSAQSAAPAARTVASRPTRRRTRPRLEDLGANSDATPTDATSIALVMPPIAPTSTATASETSIGGGPVAQAAIAAPLPASPPLVVSQGSAAATPAFNGHVAAHPRNPAPTRPEPARSPQPGRGEDRAEDAAGPAEGSEPGQPAMAPEAPLSPLRPVPAPDGPAIDGLLEGFDPFHLAPDRSPEAPADQAPAVAPRGRPAEEIEEGASESSPNATPALGLAGLAVVALWRHRPEVRLSSRPRREPSPGQPAPRGPLGLRTRRDP